VELLLFGAAAVALAAAGHGLLAALFAAAVAVNEILLIAWRQRSIG